VLLWPHTQWRQSQRTFDIPVTKSTHFRQSQPSWTCSTWWQCQLRHGQQSQTSRQRSTFDKPATKSKVLATKSTVDLVAALSYCRLCCQCVSGFRMIDLWLFIKRRLNLMIFHRVYCWSHCYMLLSIANNSWATSQSAHNSVCLYVTCDLRL